MRLGYMGHLTFISDEVCKLIEKCASDFEDECKGDKFLFILYLDLSLPFFSFILEFIEIEEWQTYLSGVHFETKERDNQNLGGVRPIRTPHPHSMPLMAGIGSSLDDADIGIFGNHARMVNDGVEEGASGSVFASTISSYDRGEGFFDSSSPAPTTSLSPTTENVSSSFHDESGASWPTGNNWD
jgi:hypothetical protein